jgi:hypothetical protein
MNDGNYTHKVSELQVSGPPERYHIEESCLLQYLWT